MKPFIIFLLSTLVQGCSPKLSPDSGWNDKKWVLLELKGVPVQVSGTDKDAHLVFLTGEKRIAGSGGCNRIMGTYSIGNKSGISFNDPAMTKMSCPDQAFEEMVLATLRSVDRYAVNGNEMLLKKGDELLMKLRAR